MSAVAASNSVHPDLFETKVGILPDVFALVINTDTRPLLGMPAMAFKLLACY